LQAQPAAKVPPSALTQRSVQLATISSFHGAADLVIASVVWPMASDAALLHLTGRFATAASLGARDEGSGGGRTATAERAAAATGAAATQSAPGGGKSCGPERVVDAGAVRAVVSRPRRVLVLVGNEGLMRAGVAADGSQPWARVLEHVPSVALQSRLAHGGEDLL
jgi:hypothetical protein